MYLFGDFKLSLPSPFRKEIYVFPIGLRLLKITPFFQLPPLFTPAVSMGETLEETRSSWMGKPQKTIYDCFEGQIYSKC